MRDESTHTTHEVRVHMRFCNRANAVALTRGKIEVAIDVAGRINDDRFLRRWTANEI